VAAGSAGLVGGQVDDLRFDPKERESARVESVHRRKSAALISAAIAGGARLGGADEATVERLSEFGVAVGVGFQIADDLLDSDEEDGCSLVAVLGAEAAVARAAELLDGALHRIEHLGEPAEPLRELARYAVQRSE
jgi:geranylgeranyl diphosphate synthase type II